VEGFSYCSFAFGILMRKNATRNPQLSMEIVSEKLISFWLAHIGRILLTLHEKKKTTPEEEWVYPELGFMS